jgi:hypothetical protein
MTENVGVLAYHTEKEKQKRTSKRGKKLKENEKRPD